jgi:aminoglycoside 6'-N-acetyltransferase
MGDMALITPNLVLSTGRLTLRPSRGADVAALVAVLAEPAVSRWWQTTSREDILDELGSGFTVLDEERVSGWLLVTEETEPTYRHVAFDLALATRLHGQGHGREVLRTIVRHCVAHGHHRFTIDPAVDNAAAIRCYTAVGFRPVGVLREYERWPDGRWGDGLLMDLLARELAEEPRRRTSDNPGPPPKTDAGHGPAG